MSTRAILPYDIIFQIIDTVGEDKDMVLLKELALVSRSFHRICCKHLFATVELLVELDNPNPKRRRLFSKKSFVNILKSRPEVVKYIRKLTYEVNTFNDDDYLLSPILPNFLRTISHLNCLTIDCSESWLDWHSLDSSLTSAFLYLMSLPTINHLSLSYIKSFPLSSFTLFVNLLRLDIYYVEPLEMEVVVESEMIPKIRDFRTSSPLLMPALLYAKKQDGQPAFNFMDLRQLHINFGDQQSIQYLLQNAMLLEKLHLFPIFLDETYEGLHDVLSAGAGTYKALSLKLSLNENLNGTQVNLPFEGLSEELEAMAGHNMLESLSLTVEVLRYETADVIGSMIQNVEKVLVKHGWSALRQVSFEVPVACRMEQTCQCAELAEELQSLIPDKYLSHLSKHESVTLNFSSYVPESHIG